MIELMWLCEEECGSSGKVKNVRKGISIHFGLVWLFFSVVRVLLIR